MGYCCEQAKSSRAKCGICNEIISQDEIKLVLNERGQFYPTSKSYCKKCGKKLITEQIEELNKLYTELK